jgi:hypothetical protein
LGGEQSRCTRGKQCPFVHRGKSGDHYFPSLRGLPWSAGAAPAARDSAACLDRRHCMAGSGGRQGVNRQHRQDCPRQQARYANKRDRLFHSFISRERHCFRPADD